MKLNSTLRPLTLFSIGGLIYVLIEILWRGYSSWTMFIAAGISFVLIGLINEVYTFEMSLIIQMLISSIIITVIEFIFGYILNVKLGMGIWDYSDRWGNIMAQICPLYTFLWFLLSCPAIILDDYLRYWLYGEEKPHYKII